MEVQKNIAKPPLLSVCIFAYNHEKFITQAIESVLGQKTTFDFEILIGEDGSKDITPDIVKNYEIKYPEKIKVLFQDQSKKIYINGNPTGRYNFITTLQTCRGKYIALLDGDDYWTDPLKLQKQVDFLEGNPSFSSVFSKIIEIDKNGAFIKNIERVPKGVYNINTAYLLQQNVIHTCSFTFRKSIIGEKEICYISKMPYGDVPLFLVASCFGPIFYINEIMSAYRKDVGVMKSIPKTKKPINSMYLREYFLNEYRNDKKLWAEYSLGQGFFLFKLCQGLIAENKNAEAIKIYFHLFKNTFKTWLHRKKIIREVTFRHHYNLLKKLLVLIKF
ncbi:MAG: glycosyltransferase [Saprospiraceae bacterium]|nr:glycosyltransferase [Saprospiraceae bacterium]